MNILNKEYNEIIIFLKMIYIRKTCWKNTSKDLPAASTLAI